MQFLHAVHAYASWRGGGEEEKELAKCAFVLPFPLFSQGGEEQERLAWYPSEGKEEKVTSKENRGRKRKLFVDHNTPSIYSSQASVCTPQPFFPSPPPLRPPVPTIDLKERLPATPFSGKGRACLKKKKRANCFPTWYAGLLVGRETARKKRREVSCEASGRVGPAGTATVTHPPLSCDTRKKKAEVSRGCFHLLVVWTARSVDFFHGRTNDSRGSCKVLY